MARGYDLTDEQEVKQYLRDIETEYHFHCLHEKLPDGCHRLAEFRDVIKKDTMAAAPLYKENCDTNNYPESCYKYGQCLFNGSGAADKKPDFLSALKYMERSCDLNVAGGCLVAAQLRVSEKVGSMQDAEKAMSLYSKACSLGHGEACLKLSTMYLLGELCKKNLKQAYEFAKRGCDLGNLMACNNLSVMYRYGHGTDKNARLAEEAKKRVVLLAAADLKDRQHIKVNE